MGTAPSGGFDPLRYWIGSAHARGLELHAWLNPYRITTGKKAEWDALPASHPAKQHADWVVPYNGNYYWNPGIPGVVNLLESGVREILDNKAEFIQSMDDDLNTADGISDIFELASHINQTANENSSKEYLQAAFDIFSELTGVLNIIQKHASVDEEKINHLIEKRDQAKRNKDFAQADQIRDQA